jgi:hypothetical protein
MMKSFWHELTDLGSMDQLKRLALFITVAFLYFGVALPLFHWLFLNGNVENIGVPKTLAPNFDNFYSAALSAVLIMELAYQSTRKSSLIWIAIAGILLFQLPLVAMIVQMLKMASWSTDLLFGMGKQFLFFTDPLVLVLTLIGVAVPITIGLLSKNLFVSANRTVWQGISWGQFLKLVFLYIVPFAIVAGVIFVSFLLTGVGAMLAFFFLVPWIYLLMSYSAVCFIALTMLRLKSYSGFSAWLAVMSILLPIVHYVFKIEFPEHRTNAVSLLIFGLIVLWWRKWICKVLPRKAPVV